MRIRCKSEGCNRACEGYWPAVSQSEKWICDRTWLLLFAKKEEGPGKKKAIRLDTRPDSCLRGPPLVLVKKINSDWKSVNETYRE